MNRRGSILVALLKLIIFLVFLALVLKVSINYAEITLSEYFNRQEVEVPNFSEKSLKDVETVSRQLKLSVEVIKRQSDNHVPPDHVISQTPPPGTTVKSGRMIELIVSSGAHQVQCPNVVGKNVMEAPFLIQKAGFLMGEQSTQFSEVVPEKHIIAQSPVGGGQAPLGSRVNLLISLGRSRYSLTVPDLVGYRIEAARLALEKLGLRLGEVGYRAKAGKEDFTVLEQSPRGNSQVGPGATIDLVVNRMDEAPPENIDAPRMEIVKFVVPPGPGPREVKLWLQDETGGREIYRNTHYPTEEIDVSVSGMGAMKVLIYLDENFFSEMEF